MKRRTPRRRTIDRIFSPPDRFLLPRDCESVA
jgi:hypothetical protein